MADSIQNDVAPPPPDAPAPPILAPAPPPPVPIPPLPAAPAPEMTTPSYGDDPQIHVFSPSGEMGTLPSSQVQAAQSAGFRIPSDEEMSDYMRNQQYGTPLQQAATVAEGFASSNTFGLSTEAEKLLGVDPAGITQLDTINPGDHALGEIGGLLSPIGPEAALLKGAGKAVEGAVATAIKGSGILGKVGAKAASEAAQMALMGGGDEASKLIADPDYSVRRALSVMWG